MSLDLSTEAKENLFNHMLTYIKESYKEGPSTATLSVDTLKSLTNSDLTENSVFDNDEDLTSTYKHIVSTYGFDNFSDLYSYAKSCDDSLEKSNTSRNKDTDKLDKVTRTVMRNGKPMEMTVYEDPEAESKNTKKVSSSDKGNNNQQDSEEKVVTSVLASPLANKISNSKLLEVKKLHGNLQSSSKFNANARNYLLFYLEESIVAILGFDISDDYVSVRYFDNNPSVSNLDHKAIYETIYIALSLNLGVTFKHTGTKTFDYIMEDLGAVEDTIEDTIDMAYSIDRDTLTRLFNYGRG